LATVTPAAEQMIAAVSGNVDCTEAVAAGADDVKDFACARFCMSSGGETIDLSRRARANAVISCVRLALLRECSARKAGF
jgi:hypothetical protein